MRNGSRQAGLCITERDLRILRKVNASGWLATEQIRDYFFPGKTTNAVSKRLRKLVRGKYLAMARQGPTQPGFYRLAGNGKLALVEQADVSENEVVVSAQFPRNLRHFTGVNLLRYRFEQIESPSAQLRYFYSERELWRYDQRPELDPTGLLVPLKQCGLIPDAIARVEVGQGTARRELNLLIEYDAGTEHASFFGRTKIRQYAVLVTRNWEWLGEVKVLTFVPAVKRLVRLMRQAVAYQSSPHLFYFAPVSELEQSHWEAEAVFLEPNDFFLPVRRGAHVEVLEKEIPEGAVPKHSLLHLPASSPHRPSPREERMGVGKA